MDNLDKNADVLTILDSLQDYAAEYEARKKKQEEEEKKNKEEAERALAQAEKKKKVEEEIAEILGKIKKQEAEDAKRFEEERKLKEAKRKKEEEMKAKIAEELAKMQKWEEEQQEKIAREQQRRADEKLRRLMKEREEQKKKEEWEAARLAEKKKAEEAEKRRKEEKEKEEKMKREIAEELAKIQHLEEIQQAKLLKEMQLSEEQQIAMLEQDKEELKKKEKKEALALAEKAIQEAKKKKMIKEEMQTSLRAEQEKRKARDEELRRQRIEEEEKKRQLIVEEEKKRLLAEEKERQMKEAEAEAQRRREEDQRMAAEILARRQAEEEERQRLKKEAEAERLRMAEEAKAKALEDKKKAFEKKQEEKPKQVLEKPKRKSVVNPFAQKFEEIAANALEEEKLQQELAKKKKKEAKKAKEMLRRSKQILHRASKESIRKSQSLFKKKSSDSLKGENLLQKSFTNLRRSLSKEQVRQSKAHLYDKEKNLSSKNLSQQGNSSSSSVSKQKMQNYLVSQVLFDGKEDVRTSRMQLQSRAAAIQEEKEREKKAIQFNLNPISISLFCFQAEAARIEEENKRKELAMIERENEMKRQIEEELNRIKKIEEEQRIKHEEAQFESYKKEMEKYLNFVCEEDDSKPKKAKRKSIVKPSEEQPTKKEAGKKLTLNIGSLKNQFEECEAGGGKETPAVKSAPATVRKLNPIKIFNEQKEEEKKPKKKEYVPVIIDKAAFERTVGMFEKEKQEKEDNEKRIKKRREAMEEEKKRLVLEKERQMAEEMERQRREEEMKAKIAEELAKMKEEEQRKQRDREAEEAVVKEPEPEPAKPDIFEQIRSTLAKIKEDEEAQRIRIEKERKKKELCAQIQQEIDKIQTVDSSLKERDEDNTPAWVKMVLGDKKKPDPVAPKVEEKKEAKRIDRTVVAKPETEVEEEDVFAPKWITMFQERNRKLQAQKAKMEEEERNRQKKLVLNQSVSVDDNSNAEEQQSNQGETLELKKSKTIGTLELKDFEPVKKKSVHDRKNMFEVKEKDEKVEVEKKSGKQKVADKVKRVKSLLMEGNKTEQKEKTEKKVTKQKANQMKNIFETKGVPSEADKAPEKPKRPKKKLVKPLNEETNEVKPVPKKEQVWKWKEKSVSELYEFINHNRKHLPDTLATKADKTFSKETVPNPIVEESMELEEDIEEYITDVQTYINEEDKDETESVFKDTILAYLDLIDANPRREEKTSKLQEKKISLVSASAMKDLLESGREEAESERREVVVGKVDSSFLFKESDSQKVVQSYSKVSQEKIKGIKDKYEELGMPEEPRELYSMKRKLKVVPVHTETLEPTKKERVQYQWKYKQKGIEELQKFLMENKERVEKKSDEKKTAATYVPTFTVENLTNRNIEDEDKKMAEFDKFMEEMHEYLETDTLNEEESTFKWGIHAYLDLIEEDSESKPGVKYEKKEKRILPEHVAPKMADIKAKLQEQSAVRDAEEKSETMIGKVDTSFLQKDNTERQIKKTCIEVPATAGKMRAQFEEQDKPVEEMERVVVKRKLIDFGVKNTKDNGQVAAKREVSSHQWKYKQKSLAELQEFISKNKDIAPNSLVVKSKEVRKIDSSALLSKSNQLMSNIEDKEGEFNEFMDELEDFLGKSSHSKEEDSVKEGIQGYLDLIDDQESEAAVPKLPSIGSVKKVRDIKSSLSSAGKVETKDSNKLIGKVSHFFKKSTNEKVDSAAIRENIATLLQPGKAKTLSKSFESKPKMARASSALDLSTGPRKLSLDQFIRPEAEKTLELNSPKKNSEQKWSYKERKSETPRPLVEKVAEKVAEKHKYEWDNIKDPVEKQNAILAKYGLKPRKLASELDREEEEMDDILNYECSEDVNRCKT